MRTGEAVKHADTLREERIALEQRHPRPRGLQLLAAGLAVAVAVLAGFVFHLAQEPPPAQASLPPTGEPLKLEFAFPAARR